MTTNTNTKKNILLIDSNSNYFPSILYYIDLNKSDFIVFNSNENTYDDVIQLIHNNNNNNNKKYESIGIFQNNSDELYYQFSKKEEQCLLENDSSLTSWNEYINFLNLLKTEFSFINLDLIVCALYSEPKWKFVIDELETQLQIQISTSNNINQNGYWFFETNKGINLRDVYFINQEILEITPQINTTKKLLLIDNRIKNIELIINSMNDNTYCLVFNYFYDTYETLLSKIRFLSGSNRYILDNFFYEEPQLPVRKDSEGNHCTTCEEFSIDDLVLSPTTLESEYLNNDNNNDSDNNNNNNKLVFFQREKKIELNSSIIYRKRPFVNITDLDAIYQIAQTLNQVTNITFECIGIIQHTVQPYLGYKLINKIEDIAVIENIQTTDSNLLSWSSFSSFIQTLKTLYQITTLDLMACALYANPDWKYIIDNLSIKDNITIRASNDNTGSSNYGGNWILETNDINLTNVYFTDKIYEWQYVLATYIDNRFYGLRFNDSMYATKSYDARLKIAAGTSNFTIETWYYETAARYNCTIVDMGDYNYTFQIRNLNTTNAVGLSFYNAGLGANNSWLYGESAVVPVAQWSHLAITRSGSTFTFYVNGIARQTFTNSGSLYSNNSTFAIGWQSPDSCSCNRMKTDCVLYDIRLWNVARTASEIQMNRNRVIPANSSGLVANYLCTDNSNTFNDRTSNALHTTIQNYDSARWTNSLVPIPNVGFLINNGYSLTSYNSTALNALTHFDNITYTDFSNINLSNVNFTNADLTGCNFTSANLSNAVLNGANLTNANLTNAILDGTYLIGAILTGATTTGSTITAAITTTTLTKNNSSAFYLTPPTGVSTTYGPTWSQLGSTIFGSNDNDTLNVLSISKDGNIIAVSSPGNDSTGTDRGFIKIFKWNSSSWNQLGGTFYGISNNDLINVSKLSSDGNYVAFRYNDSAVSNKGFIGVFIYDSNKTVEDTNVNSASYGPIGWSRVGGFIYNEFVGDNATSIGLSGNGQIIALGCSANDGTSGSSTDNRGNVRVYRYDPSKLSEVTDQANVNFGPVGWTRMGVDIDGESAGDNFGTMIELSTDGTVLAGAAVNSDVNGTDNGQVRVFKWNTSSSTWVQRGRTIYGQLFVSWDSAYRFAYTLSLSADGNVIACGNSNYASYRGITKTLQWNSFNNDYQIVGQQLEEYGDWQLSGHSVSLSSDGQILAVGAYDADRGLSNNGAVRVYKLTTYATTLVSSPPTNMTGYSRDNTTIYRMTITGNSSTGSVFGTNLYTADSNIARAAVHAGVIANGETKEIYIKMERFQYKYFGSTRNGVTSSDYTDNSMTYLSYYFMDSPKLWVQIGNEIAGQGANYYIGGFAALSGNGTTLAVTGFWSNNTGLVQVYSLSSTDNYSHTSSITSIAEVYGDIVIPKKAGFTTIASKQSSTITTSLLAITGIAPTFTSFPSVSKFTTDSQFTLTLPESNSTGAFTLTTGTVGTTVKYTRNALRFDGVNDTVILNSFPTLNSTNQLTIEGWVFITNYSTTIICLNDNSDVGINSQGRIVFSYTIPFNWYYVISDISVPLNTWVYIAIVKNDNGYNKIYINNNIVRNEADTVPGVFRTCVGISLASNALGNSGYSSVILSELRIWSVARTEKQIRDNYNREVLSNSTGLQIYYKFNQGTAGGNNTGLTTLTDSTSNNYHGTITNFALSGTTSNYVTGVTMLSKDKYNITNETSNIATINPDISVNALNFNGTNNYIDLVSNITELGQGNFTIECWIKTTGTRMGILNCQDSDNPPNWEAGEKSFYLDSSGKPAFVGFGNNFILSTQAVDDNNWHHIAVVWSYSTSTGFIYIDGQDRTNKLNNFPYQAINNNTGRFIVGVPTNQESVNYFSGSMCELRIWSIARTASQIYQNFRRILNGDESGLVCYNRLNQGTANGSNSGLTTAINNMLSGGYAGSLSGFSLVSNTSNWTDGISLRPNKDVTITGPGVATITAIQEESGIYDMGTTTATVTVALKEFSSILTLDGVDDAVNIGVPAWTYSTQFRTTMTVECWFKTSDTNNQKTWTTLVGRNRGGGVSSLSQFALIMIPTGEIRFELTNTTDNQEILTTTSSYKDGLWHHVAVTYNSVNGEKKIYIDGSLSRTDTVISGFGLMSNNTTIKMVLGSDSGALDVGLTDRQFRGSLSDIRIWSIVRTASEISNNYRQRLIGNESNLLGYWKLNQGYGSGWGSYTIALDSTSNRSNGTLTNFATASSNWTLSTLAFLPRISDITLGSKNGLYSLSDSSFTFTDPLSNSFGNFSYAINSAVATISNGIATTKTVYTTSGAVTIPTLSLYDFPEIASLADWEINVSFTVTGGAGSWRALLGDMYNEINSSRGWGIWVSSAIPSKIHWSFVDNTFEPAQTLVSLNTPYILNVAKSSAGTITLTLQNVAGTYNNSLSISNLVAQYNFDSNGNDSSPNNNNLTNVNTVTFNTSNYKRGSGAALFNGTNYFEIANDGRFSPDNFTVALWINPKTINSYQSIASCRGSSPWRGWMIYISPSASGSNLEIWSSTDGSNFTSQTSLFSGFGTINTWVHLAFTLNKSSSALIVYINGTTVTTTTLGYTNNTTTNLRIGAGANEQGANFHLVNGTLVDDFRFYNKVLSAAEIGTIVADSSFSSVISIGSNVIGKGPVTIGGWRSYGGEIFPGTISNVNVKVPTNQRLVTLVSNTSGTPATITATQDSFIEFDTGTKTASLTIGNVTPTLSNFTIPAKDFGTSPFTLTPPTSNSPGTFTYTSSNTAVATISGSTVTIVGAGTSTIEATQASSGSYVSGTVVTTLTVNQIAPTLSNFTVAAKNYGDSAFTLTAPTSNSSGAFTYTSSNTNVATIALPGIDWTIRNSVADNGWNSVVYGNGLWIAVAISGSGNRVMTSPDGINWTSRTNPVDNQWMSVAYGNGLWVAIAQTGTGNRVMTSPNGINWTIRTSAADNSWKSVAYGNGLWVAVSGSGSGNRVMTSPDGINWTIRTTPVDNVWLSVAYGNGLWVAVAQTGSGSGDRVMTSPDGINWTIRSNSVDNQWFSVAYGNGLWVAVSSSGSGNRVMTSPNGITWTSRTSAADNNWQSVAYGNGLWVAVAATGIGNRVMTSPDGITWTIRTNPVDNNWCSIAYGNGVWVGVAYSGSGNRVMTSSGDSINIIGAGSSTIEATQAASGNYTSGTVVTTLTVNTIAPSLSNFTVAAKNYGSSPFTLTPPTSNSPGTFTYTSSNTAVATISGSTVTIVAGGTSTIEATQASSGSYVSGTIVATLTVNQTAPTIGALTIPAKNYGDATFSLTAPTSNSSGAFTYTSSNTDVATIIPSNIFSINNPTLYSKLTNFPSISTLSDWEISISFVTTISGRYQALIGDRTGYNTNGWTFWLNPWGGVHITSYTEGIYWDYLNGTISANTNYIFTIKRTPLYLYIFIKNVSTGITVSSNTDYISAGKNLILTPDANVYVSLNSASEGFVGTILAINVSNLNLSSINIVSVGTSTITATQAATTNYTSGSVTGSLVVSPIAPILSNFTVPAKNYGDSAFNLTPPTSSSTTTSSISSTASVIVAPSGINSLIYGNSWIQRGNDIDGEVVGDENGGEISLSADGNVVAITAVFNDANGNDSGCIRIYAWNGSTWIKRGVNINGEAADDYSGRCVSLSADGSIVAIGAFLNNGNGTDAGQVRVYVWNGTTWIQRGTDIDGENTGDQSGTSVKLSADGSVVAIGGPYNDGNGTDSGHVRIYEWNSSTWVKRGVDIDGEAINDLSGYSVGLSADGSVVAIGANYNDGNGTDAGHVRVYVWNGSIWTKRGADIDGEAVNDLSGWCISLSADGSIIAIGAPNNDGNGTDSGHVRVYAWNGSTWVKRGLDIDGEAVNDFSGRSVSLSADGSVVAIGAPFNDGNGNESGQIRIYVWNGSTWNQRGMDIDGEVANDRSGWSVSISADGSIVAIGAPRNSSAGNFSGHARIYKIPITNELSYSSSNSSVADIYGNLLLIKGINGSSTITASQTGNIINGRLDVFGTTYTFQYNPFTYTSSNTAVATISGSIVTIVGGGTTTITATQPASGNYASATIVTTLVVSIPSGISSPTFTKESNQWYFNFQYGGSTQLTLFTINLTWYGGGSINQDFSSLTSSYGTNKYLINDTYPYLVASQNYSAAMILGKPVTATINYTESGVAKQTITTFVPNPITGGPYTTGISNFNTNILPATCTATIPSALDQQRVNAGRGWHYTIRFTETATGTITSMASYHASGGLQSSFPVTIPMALYGKTFTCQLIIYNDGGSNSGDFIVQNYNTTNNTSFTIPHPTGIYPTQVTELWHTGMNWQTGGPLEDTRLYRVRWFVGTTALDINSPNYVSKVRVNIKLSSDSGYRFTGVYNYADGLGYSMFHSSIRSPLGQNIGTWIVDIRTENSDATITTSYQTLSQYGGVPAYGNYFTLDQLAAEAGSSIIQYGENVASTFKVSNFAQSSGYTWTLNGGQIYKYLTNVLFKSASMYGTSISTYKHKLELINPDATKTTIGLYDMNGSSPNITMWPLNPSSTYTVKITIVDSSQNEITNFFAMTNGYDTATFQSLALNVPAAPSPTLSNFTVGAKNYGDAPFTLTAPTSNSSGAFTYTSSNTDVATISGITVTIVGGGSTTITATQADTGTYTSGTITASLVVSPIAPTLSNFSIATKYFGQPTFTITAPTTNSNGALTYTSSNTAVATISGSTVTILSVGTSTITATQASTANYTSGTIVTTLTINSYENANLTGLDLSNNNLTGLNLSNSTLTNVTSGSIIGNPTLPANYVLINGYIIGPNVNLTNVNLSSQNLTNANFTGVNLTGANLTSATLTGVISGSITGNPTLSASYSIINGYILGPNVNLSSKNLSNMNLLASNLTNVNLNSANIDNTDFSNTTLTGVKSGSVTGTPILPNNYSIIKGCIVGSNVDLTSATLTNINYSKVSYNAFDDFISGPTAQSTSNDWQYFEVNTDRSSASFLSNWQPEGTDNIPNYGQWDNNRAFSSYPLIQKIADSGTITNAAGYNVPFTGPALVMHPDSSATYNCGLGYKNNTGNTININIDIALSLLFGATNNLDGVNYFIQRGLINDARYKLYINSSIPAKSTNTFTFNKKNIELQNGEFIYLILNRNGNFEWDFTRVVFNITLNNFRNLTLTNVNFTNANLSGTNLSGTTLTNSNISNTNLTSAIFNNLISSGLTGTPLLSSNYNIVNNLIIGPSVNLTNVDLSNQNLTNINLSGTILTGANLTGATLTGIASGSVIGTPTLSAAYTMINGYVIGPNVNLTNATLNSQNLTNKDLSGTNLSGANLTSATLTGVISGSVIGTPTLSATYSMVNGYVVGPNVNLTNATLNSQNLTNKDLSGTNLTGANLTGATLTGVLSGSVTGTPTLSANYNMINGYVVGPSVNLTNATLNSQNLTNKDLSGANLTGTNLTGATLTGVISGSVTGTPTLSAAYTMINGYVVGPNVNLTNATLNSQNLTNKDLSGANLTGANLTSATLTGVISGSVTGTPTFSASYSMVNGYVVGPNVNLTNATLSNQNLSNKDLSGATLTGANLSGITVNTSTVFTNAVFTNVTTGNISGTTNNFPTNYNIIGGYVIGPSVNLVNATLSGANLSSKNLTGVDLTGANLSGANLSNVTINSNTNFTNSTLTNVSSGSLSGTTSTFPTNYNIIGGYVVGPSVNLSNATLSGLNLSSKILTGVNFTNANLTNAILTGSTIDNSTNITNATLTNVTTGSLIGTSTNFSSSYNLINGYVVGPSVNLTGANLSGQDLTNKDLSSANLTNVNLTSSTLTGLKTGSITGTPTLSTDYTVVNNYILGPSVNLTNANLANQNLTNVNLSGANLSGTVLTDATLTGLVTSSITGAPTMNTAYTIINGYVVGPSVNLTNANLSGQDLTGKDLSNVNLSNANLSNATTTNIILSNTNINNADITNITFSNIQKAQLLKNTNNRSISNVQISNLSGTDILSLIPNSTISTINNISSVVFKVIPPSVENTIDLSLVTTGAFYVPSSSNESVIIDGKTYYSTSSAIINSSTGLATETLTFGTKIYKLFSGSIVGVELNLDTYKIYGIGFSNIFETKGTLSSFSNSITVEQNLTVQGTSTLTGNVGINKSPSETYDLDVLGTVRALSFTQTSDYRIKEDISNIEDNIDELKPVKYKNKLNNKMEYGFIAHEVQDFFPEIVQGEKDGEEYQSINYSGLIPILVNEIKKLKEEIKNLKK